MIKTLVIITIDMFWLKMWSTDKDNEYVVNCPNQPTCFAHFDLCIFRCFITKKHSGAISYDKCPTFCVFKPYPQFLVLSFCLTSMPIIAKIHHDAGNFQFVFFSQMILRITRDQQRHFFSLESLHACDEAAPASAFFASGACKQSAKKCKKCAKMQTPWKTICP